MRKFVMHSMQVFLARFKDASDDFVCHSANVKPVLIYPGPKGPSRKLWRPLWWLIFLELGATFCSCQRARVHARDQSLEC